MGEALFRLSRLVLDSAGYQPGGWRELFALLIAPVAGVNRLMFGDKYRGELMLPPSWLGEFRFGAVVAGTTRSSATGGARELTVGPWASLALDLIYGIPGTPGLELKHPFDHFTFIAPALFRVGGFGFGPGVSLMKRWGSFELHGTALAEALPWAGGGTTEPLGVRDYHYGPGVGALIELRAHFGDRVTARLAGREYWIGGNDARGQSEDNSYGRADLTLRIYGMPAVSGGVNWGYRRARSSPSHSRS